MSRLVRRKCKPARSLPSKVDIRYKRYKARTVGREGRPYSRSRMDFAWLRKSSTRPVLEVNSKQGMAQTALARRGEHNLDVVRFLACMSETKTSLSIAGNSWEPGEKKRDTSLETTASLTSVVHGRAGTCMSMISFASDGEGSLAGLEETKGSSSASLKD